MANYRFKTAEIEAMKKNILTQIEREVETKTAWRLRCAIEGQLMCCRPSKREAARLERELALYEKLTKNDLPNWQIEPTQPATPTETSQISTESAETVNVSAEVENAAETKENCHSDTRIVSDGYGTQYEVTRHWKNGRVESLDVIVLDTQPQTATEPSQSPEAPRAVEYATDAPKPRETARKRPNRAIGSAQHHQYSALGANGYSVLNDASMNFKNITVTLHKTNSHVSL